MSQDLIEIVFNHGTKKVFVIQMTAMETNLKASANCKADRKVKTFISFDIFGAF